MGKKIREMKDELLADEEFRREYDALEEEFSIAAQLIEARTKAKPEHPAGNFKVKIQLGGIYALRSLSILKMIRQRWRPKALTA